MRVGWGLVLTALAGWAQDDPYSVGVTLISGKGCALIVGGVSTKSPADASGIRAGDHLLAVDGLAVASIAQAGKLLRLDAPGRVKLRLSRGGKEYEKEVDRERISSIVRKAGNKIVKGVVVPPDTTDADVDRMLAFDGRRTVARVFPSHYPENADLYYGGFEIFVLRDPEQIAVGGIEDGPAARAGLHWGDAIVSVNGVDVRGKSPAELEALFARPSPERVLLRTERLRVSRDIEFLLQRAADILTENGQRLYRGRAVPAGLSDEDADCISRQN